MSGNKFVQDLDAYVRRRARLLGLSMSDVARHACLSRQALYKLLSGNTGKARIGTFVMLADALEVHPINLMRYVCAETHLPGYTSNASLYKHDGSGFIRDATVPDNSPVMADSHFEKIWEIQNVGQVVWVSRALLCMDEELEITSKNGQCKPASRRGLIPDERRISIPETKPGESVRLSVS